MTNLRETCSFQTPKASRAWLGNLLFIAACAAAAGISTLLFTPHYSTAITKISEKPRSSQPKNGRASQIQISPLVERVQPSFDCTRVKSTVLKLVCATPTLATLDQQLAEAYRAALLTSPSPREIIETERRWIKIRNNAEPNVLTIGVLYSSRIDELRRLGNSAATSTGAASQNPSATIPPNSMTFTYHDNPKLAAVMDMDFREIHADGAITPGTAARFADFLKVNAVSPGASVILNSPGGSVIDAIELGKEIRKAALSTIVEAQRNNSSAGGTSATIAGCFSACTLAFLGGVERTVEPGALFGVHQVSTTASLTANEALQAGQAMIGTIVEYSALMGAKAEFVYELTRASPDGINILSQAQLLDLNVTTPAFHTEWRVKPIDGKFYLVGTTTMNRGTDHLIVGCAKSGPQILFLFNTTGRYMQDTLDYTTDYGLEFDTTHMDLVATEIAKRVTKMDDRYVGVTIELSTRILDALQAASNVTFEMMMPSHVTYAGWTTDFASGRDQFNSFLKSCH